MTAYASERAPRPDEIRASAIFTDQTRLVRVRLWARCPDSSWTLGLALAGSDGQADARRLRLRLVDGGTPRPDARPSSGVRREAEAIVENSWAREVVIVLADGEEIAVPVAEPAGTRRVPLASA